MRPLIAYIRVSSKEQGESGVGLEVQLARIQAYAEESGFRIVETFQEVASAIGEDTYKYRPELQAALRRGARLRCPVAMTQTDRLSRSALEIEHLLRPGHDFIFVQDAEEDVRIKTKAAAVQKQTELLKSRTRDGIRRAKERGVLFGNPVNLTEAQQNGARANRNAAKEHHAELTPIIKSIQAEGISSGSEIAKRLNQLGKKTRRGGDWTDANMRRVLRDMIRDDADRRQADAEYRKVPGYGDWG